VDHITDIIVGGLEQISDVQAGCPCADINTTIARRNRTGSFAVRVIRCNR
jgi:hypothetical protein